MFLAVHRSRTLSKRKNCPMSNDYMRCAHSQRAQNVSSVQRIMHAFMQRSWKEIWKDISWNACMVLQMWSRIPFTVLLGLYIVTHLRWCAYWLYVSDIHYMSLKRSIYEKDTVEKFTSLAKSPMQYCMLTGRSSFFLGLWLLRKCSQSTLFSGMSVRACFRRSV